MHEGDLIELRRFDTEMVAETARELLEAEGILATLRTDDCGGQLPGLSGPLGIVLLVNPEDRARATELLDAHAGPEPVVSDNGGSEGDPA